MYFKPYVQKNTCKMFWQYGIAINTSIDNAGEKLILYIDDRGIIYAMEEKEFNKSFERR